jgi:hypothetical protein
MAERRSSVALLAVSEDLCATESKGETLLNIVRTYALFVQGKQ